MIPGVMCFGWTFCCCYFVRLSCLAGTVAFFLVCANKLLARDGTVTLQAMLPFLSRDQIYDCRERSNMMSSFEESL